MIPSGVEIPAEVGEPAEPPHVLFVGRLSEEKGILDFLAATEGLPRVIVGDGPLRGRVPEAVGFVPPGELGPYYERAAVVCVPSHREGYGVVAREAMAYGRPGGRDARSAGSSTRSRTGSPACSWRRGDPRGLGDALRRLLGDAGERRRLGAAGRRFAEERWALGVAAESLVECYQLVSRAGDLRRG